eukprot:171994-Pelagomonas_calceolata.AAC.3
MAYRRGVQGGRSLVFQIVTKLGISSKYGFSVNAVDQDYLLLPALDRSTVTHTHSHTHVHTQGIHEAEALLPSPWQQKYLNVGQALVEPIDLKENMRQVVVLGPSGVVSAFDVFFYSLKHRSLYFPIPAGFSGLVAC